MSAEALERLRALVARERELAESLRGLGASFRERVAAAARERGLGVTEADLAEAEREARRSWLERWLDA